MYKVMLVDDEKQIIHGLTHIIRWDELNCKVIGEAYNGRMGIEQAVALQPDLIITDIRMPYVDGLEMIAKIQQHMPKTKFIILSGYSEFDYAKQGILLGVKDYVIKPVEEDDLEASIKRIVSELEVEKQKLAEFTQYKELSATGITFVQEQYLRDLANIDEDHSYLMEELKELGIHFPYEWITCMMAKADTKKPLSKPYYLTITEGKQCIYMIFRYTTGQYAILLNHHWGRDCLNHYETIDQIKLSLSKQLGVQMTIGVGSTYSSIRKLSTSFEEAKQMIGYSTLRKDQDTMFYDQLEESFAIFKLPEELLTQLFNALEHLNIEQMNSTLDQISQFIKHSAESQPIVDLRSQFLNLYFITASKLTTMQAQDLNQVIGEKFLAMHGMTETWTLEMYEQRTKKLFHQIIETMKNNQFQNNQRIIDEVISFMKQNYANNLTLSDTADRFYINPNYLSQLFRKRTGNTFLGYLTKIRIEQAKQLLSNTDAKIYEICSQVGYKDPKCFRKIFEREVGVKPSQYKSKTNLHV